MAERVREGATWKCSACGGFVRSDAPHCKHCKVVFEGEEVAPSAPKPPPRLAIILSLIVAAVMGAVFLFGGGWLE